MLTGWCLLTAALFGLAAASAFLPRGIAAAGSLGLCGLGFVLAAAYLLSGAAAASLALPVGLPGQETTLALDGLSGFFLLVLTAAGAASAAAALEADGPADAAAPLLPALLGALALSLLAGDAFTLMLGLELSALAVAALALTRADEAAAREAVLRHAGLAGLGAACLIAALALLAGGADGDLRFAALRAHPPEGWPAVAVLVLGLAGGAAKAGLVPLHGGLARLVVAAPAHVSALLAGGLTKVALYVLVRLLFDLCGPAQPGWWGAPLLLLGAAGAVLGALRACLEDDIKAVLAGATVGSVGLIAVGLGLALAARGTDLSSLAGLALGGAMLAALVHALVGSLLLLAAGAVQQGGGSRSLRRLGGLIQRMPVTTGCVLAGAASMAALPPSAGFAAQWTLVQALLGGARIGGPGWQALICVVVGLAALAAALAAAAAVRLVGVAFLGRPRSPRASAADETGPAMRATLIGLASASAVVGLFPGGVLALAGPALERLVAAGMAGRAGLLTVAPQADLPGYSAPGIVLVLALAVGLAVWLLRLRVVAGTRHEPAWDGGFGPPPAWLPFGDPLTQYGGASFAQPVQRTLGAALLRAREVVDAPAPGEMRAAQVSVTMQDPAERLLFRPAAAVQARLSAAAARLWQPGVTDALALLFAVLIGLLCVVAVVELV